MAPSSLKMDGRQELKKARPAFQPARLHFWGGRYFGPSGGWGASRQLEAGATLGFHPFYSQSNKKVDLSQGFEAGRLATNLLYAYTSGLGIKQDLMTEILSGSPAKIVIANTPRLLSGLGITLLGYPAQKTKLTPVEAANLLENILSANNDEDDYEFNTECKEISSTAFKKDMLKKTADSSESYDYPEIKKRILQTLKKNNNNEIDKLYKMLNALGTVPDVMGGRIFKVTGLDNIHYYKSQVGYVSIYNEGTDSARIEYLLCPLSDASGNKFCELKSLDQNGIFYDLYDPDKPLW